MARFNMTFFAFAITLAVLFVADITDAMDAPTSEYGYRDLAAAGVVPKDKPIAAYRKSGVRAKFLTRSVTTTTNVVLIAQAKLGSKRYPATPYITVDVEPNISGCGFYDWLFIPRCAAATPKNNVRAKKLITQELERAFVHVYTLPTGWKNLRLSMSSHGRCQGSRTAAMSTASRTDMLCHRAQYRWLYCRRSGRRKYLIAGPKKRRCRWLECARSHLVIRRLKHVSYSNGSGKTDTLPQVLAYNGQVYAGFQRCKDSEAPDLFRK